jgi:hypothetical protein
MHEAEYVGNVYHRLVGLGDSIDANESGLWTVEDFCTGSL